MLILIYCINIAAYMKKIELDKSYTTDGKVKLLSNEEDINVKLAKLIGPRIYKI